MTYRESLDWLYGLQIHGIKLGLQNTARLCADLGVGLETNSERRFIHVAGTNGKGSVCAMIAAMCVAAGKRTALYTSPHLVSFRERIRLGANLIPEEHVASGLLEIQRLVASWDHQPTFFEVVTVLALKWFQAQRAEWIVLETGLGGRLDATNVVVPAVSVITPISMDHAQYLGGTLPEIAGEKAGIIKAGVPVVSGLQVDEVANVLRSATARAGSRLNFVGNPIPTEWSVALRGAHQRMNAAIAFAALVAAGMRPDLRAVAGALAHAEWPGRFQVVNDGRLVLDGAHNEAGAAALARTWRDEFPGEKATLILGVMADKDVGAICRPLIDIASRLICVPVRNPRAMVPAQLAGFITELCDLPCECAGGVSEAIASASRHPERVLIAGSLFLIGEALAELGLMEGAHELTAQ